MTQDHRAVTSFSRRRFLQYTGAAGAATIGGSLLAACAGTGSGTNSSLPTLNQWYHQYGEKGTHEAVLKYAKDYTKANVKVQWKPGTGNEYPNAVRAALLSNNPPDVFELPGVGVDQIKAGLLAPLDDLIADVKDDLDPVGLLPSTVKGKVYGLKIVTDTTLFYYRKSLFQKAGIDQPPKTLDELISVAKKLTNGDIKGLYVGSDGGVDALFYNLGWSSGDLFVTNDEKIGFNTDRVVAAYSKLVDLNKSGALLPDAPDFWWSPNPFINGQCAMQWCGLWAMPQIQEKFGDDMGVFPFPALDAQGTPVMGVGGWIESVAAKSKNLDAAKAYAKYLWLDSKEVQTDFNLNYGFHVPARKSIAAQATKLKSGAAADVVAALGKYGRSNPPTWDATMENYLRDAVSNIKNGSNPASEIKTAADKCNTELQKNL